MEKMLTSTEREKLIRRHRNERDGRARDRIKAVLAYDEGYSYSEIAHILLLDDETIRRHVEDYLKSKKLYPANGGSESKLSNQEGEKLIAHLKEVTYLYVKDICAYVDQRFGIEYSVSGMTKWLHANNFRYKKPHAVPAKADKKKQEEFIKIYNRLRQKKAGKEPIFFADSVHPQHQTRLTFGWIPKGERKAIATTARQRRLNIIGGISLESHRFVYTQAEKVSSESIKSFLSEVRKLRPREIKIHIIWDNAAYHRSNKIKEYAKILNIKLHYLPPYSPNLNPIERLWKLMHEHVTYNQYYEKFSQFTEATIEFLKTIGRKKKILRARITDNFQTVQSPMLAS